MMYGWGGGGWLIMTVTVILFWAALIVTIALSIRYLTGGAGRGGREGNPPTRSAEDVLAERFARGEIDIEDYRTRTALLREHRSA